MSFCRVMFTSLIWDYGLAANDGIYLGFQLCVFFIIKSSSGLFLFGKLMGFFNLAIAILCGSLLLEYLVKGLLFYGN